VIATPNTASVAGSEEDGDCDVAEPGQRKQVAVKRARPKTIQGVDLSALQCVVDKMEATFPTIPHVKLAQEAAGEDIITMLQQQQKCHRQENAEETEPQKPPDENIRFQRASEGVHAICSLRSACAHQNGELQDAREGSESAVAGHGRREQIGLQPKGNRREQETISANGTGGREAKGETISTLPRGGTVGRTAPVGGSTRSGSGTGTTQSKMSAGGRRRSLACAGL